MSRFIFCIYSGFFKLFVGISFKFTSKLYTIIYIWSSITYFSLRFLFTFIHN
nr:MAG TPA: hypothetical protein [Caudoviricetes sp.]